MTTKTSKRILSLVLSLLLLISSIQLIAYAVTLSESEQAKIDAYKDQEEALNEKITESKKKLTEMKEDISDQQAYVSELTAQIETYQTKIDLLNDSIESLEKQQDSIQEKVDELDKEIEEIQVKVNHNLIEQIGLQQQTEDIVEDLKTCLCDLYVKGTSSELELLLSSTDFSSFLITLELTSNMAKQDDELINTLNVSIARIDELNAEQQELIEEIEVKKSEYNTQISELEAKKKEVESSKSELESSQTEIEQLYKEATSYLSVLDQQSTAYENLIDNYESQIDAFEAKIDKIIASAASKGTGKVSSKGLIWPLQYSDTYVSSSFGYRTHPITGKVKLHGGIDICSYSGTAGKSVSAAAAGTVIISTYDSSYGYYVGIDHGNGIVTVYAHNSKLLVSKGQTVSQGQTIAYAGSTGVSTGAHCHFEVRINGTKVNPLNYVSP